ncbi:MAG: hypothetical protein HFJ22_05395 [Clostridia bacterium]|jgi:GTPase SAR1 family protein|nr:hypothetical protein [Clostridia bacterium]
MNITILGYTGSGKTTYLSAMLSRFFDEDVDGFRINQEYDNDSIDEFVIQNARITRYNSKNGSVYSNIKFPPATDSNEITIIPCNLTYNNDSVLNFNIIDYPGGRLRNIAQGDTDNNLEKLASLLFTSDVAIVFIDAEQLSYFGSNMSIARNKLGVNYIREILISATQKSKESNRNLQTIFVLSKIDSELLKGADIITLKNKVADLYGNYFMSTGNVFDINKVMELGVLGYGNVRTTADKGMGYINTINEITCTNYVPINVASIFAKSWLLAKDNINCDIRNFEQQIDRMKMGFWGNLIDVLFRHSNQRNTIREKQIQLDEYKENLSRIELYATQLRRIISQKI